MRAKIFEDRALRNKRGVFRDRVEAGSMLGLMLSTAYKNAHDSIVLAIPAGGAPVGLEIRRQLNIPLDLIIVRKIPIPGNPETGFGAVALEGSVYLNQEILSRLLLTRSQIEGHIALVRKDLENRNLRLRDGRPFPDLSGKTVILVDDGLASGYTMMASIHMVRDKGARKIAVAVPTAPLRSIETIESLVEEIYCANVRVVSSFAVAEAYKYWYDLCLEEVLELLHEL